MENDASLTYMCCMQPFICHASAAFCKGVPQGSILGPLLFTLYVNDVAQYVDNAIDMYADDSILQTHAKDIKTVENKLTEILAKAAEWMKINKPTLHLGNTKAQ